MNINIVCCDDEHYITNQMHNYCVQYFSEQTDTFTFSDFNTPTEVLTLRNIDILLLDIEMCDLDGISVKNQLQLLSPSTKIIFISSHKENMPDAFGPSVYGFLTKPVTFHIFSQKMDEIISFLRTENNIVACQTLTGLKYINEKSIVYI